MYLGFVGKFLFYGERSLSLAIINHAYFSFTYNMAGHCQLAPLILFQMFNNYDLGGQDQIGYMLKMPPVVQALQEKEEEMQVRFLCGKKCSNLEEIVLVL